jgi:microcystin-dependent protein
MSEIRVDTITNSAGTGAPSFTGGLVPGMVAAFARTTAPTGWLACDGSAVSRTTYAALFAAISTTYGVGDGSTTFNLPDCRGVFMRGAGSQTISGIVHTGTQGTTQNDQVQGHYHSVSDPGHTHNLQFASATGGSTYMYYTGQAFSSPGVTYAGGVSNTTGVTVTAQSSDGSNGTPRTGSQTRPANITLLYCISI